MADRPVDSAAPDDPDDKWPFTTPAGSEASMFIQWKGTDVCLDFYCTCGEHGHFDGYFAYHVRCPKCGAIYEMGTQVIVKRRDDLTPESPSVQTLEVDTDE